MTEDLTGHCLKRPLRFLWRTYIAWAVRHPGLALPAPKKLPGAGWGWVHPYYLRDAWMPDADGVCKTLERLLEPGKSFFDVGANIGQTAIVGSRRVGRRGRVAAFEPSAPNIQMLSYHVRWNRLRNVRVESTCVGASDGEAEFSLLNNGFDTSNSLTFFRRSNLVELQQRSHKTTVRVTTIDKYCQRTNLVPDLIKIDVEGAEFDVLVGMREVLTTKRPVLVMGLHPFWWPDGQAQFAIRDILTQCDYQVKSLQGEEATPDVYADFVCSPRRV